MKKNILNFNYSLRYSARSLNANNFKRVQSNIKNGIRTKYYYNNNEILEWKEVLGTNKKTFYKYNNGSIIEKITELYKGKKTEVRIVNYSDVKVSNLYVYMDEVLTKRVTVFFRNNKKFRAASYHFTNGVMNEWQRFVYNYEQELKQKIGAKLVGETIEVEVNKFTDLGILYSKGNLSFLDNSLVMYKECMHDKNIYEVEVNLAGKYYLTETKEFGKYASIEKRFEIPKEKVEENIKCEFGDYSKTIDFFLNEDNLNEYLLAFEVK